MKSMAGIEQDVVTVWGIAAGRGTTQDAAPGAFTHREYPNREVALAAAPDWLQVIRVTKY